VYFRNTKANTAAEYRTVPTIIAKVAIWRCR